jgi:hypothetical protein
MLAQQQVRQRPPTLIGGGDRMLVMREVGVVAESTEATDSPAVRPEGRLALL